MECDSNCPICITEDCRACQDCDTCCAGADCACTEENYTDWMAVAKDN